VKFPAAATKLLTDVMKLSIDVVKFPSVIMMFPNAFVKLPYFYKLKSTIGNLAMVKRN
jgi:hypothetical protein